MEILYSVFSLVVILGLLAALYTYMYKQMCVLSERMKKKRYTPNPLKSLLEIVAFVGVYVVCSLLSSSGTLSGGYIASMTIISFIISLITFNFKTFNLFGRSSAYLSVLIIFVIHLLGFFINYSPYSALVD